MWNPLSWVMEAAAIMAIALSNGNVTNPSYDLVHVEYDFAANYS